jgi:hypothetical protein
VKDEAFKQTCRADTDGLVKDAGALCEQVQGRVRSAFQQ